MASKKRIISVITGIVFPTIVLLLANALGAISIRTIVKSVASLVHCVMLAEIPVWGMLLVALLLFGAVSLYLVLVIFRNRPPPPPEWLGFTQMEFKGHLFKWEYAWGAARYFSEMCFECGCKLHSQNCPICNTKRKLIYHSNVFMEDLENAVKWYIETGNYRDIMAKNRLDKRCFKRKNGYIRLLKVFMRRFGFLVVFLPLLFLGCDVVSYSIVLTNATETKTVFYTYNGTRNSLAPQETRLYEVGAWTQPPVNVEDEHGIASINVVTNGMTGDHTFVYVRPIILEVKNTLPVNATIRAGNFIDNGGLMELYVSTGETETAIIYTENPNFTMTGNFPANFGVNIITLTCECEDDPENDFKCIRDNDELEDIWDNSERRPQRKMYVTIR